MKNNEPLTKVFAKAWWMEDQSAVNLCCTASGLDGIFLGSYQLACTFSYYSASVPDLTNNNSKPSQILDRWRSLLSDTTLLE